MTRASAVIVAAGRGERVGTAKQFLPLGGIPLLLWSVRTFRQHPDVLEVVVVLPSEMAGEPPAWLRTESVVCGVGGETRRQSAGSGVAAAAAEAEIILIHDAARPFVSMAVLDRVLGAAVDVGAALPVLPVVDTTKRVVRGRVVETLERSGLGRAQTPQAFRADLIRELHAAAAEAGSTASDDVALCEAAGHPVAAVDGDPLNLKITTPADFAWAEWLVDSGKVAVPGSGSGSVGPV